MGDIFISFSPKYTAINAAVSVAGIPAYFFLMELVAGDDCNIDYFGLLCSLLGLILTLVVAFLPKCNSFASHFGFSWPLRFILPLGLTLAPDFASSFEFGALVTSSPNIPYILGLDGQLVKEEETHIEENKMKESSSPATSNIVLSETDGIYLNLAFSRN